MNKSNLVFGLERQYFHGDTLFDRETENVFQRNWLCLGRVEDLFEPSSVASDQYTRVSIGNFDLVVVRQADGSLASFHNVCRHRGTRLLEQQSGQLKNSCITCPYHAWTYDMAGCLIGAPNMNEQPGFNREDFPLKHVACVNWCGFVMIHLSASKEQFESDYAPIINAIADWQLPAKTLGDTLEYEVRANWKIVFQNFSECYHCPTVHPNLNRLTPFRGASNDLESGPILGGPMGMAEGYETISTDGRFVGKPFSTLDEHQQRAVFYYTLFPSMFISAHPDYVMVHQLERISNDTTKVKCYFMTEPETAKDDLRRAVDQWDEVNRQDWHVCQLTQAGVESPAYTPGPYSNLEPMLIAFDQHYRSVMG